MSISDASTRRPVAVAMLFLAVILLGAISYARLPIDLLPDVSFPRLVVYTSYPDVAPAEVERLVTEPVEAAAAAVPGVEKVTSVSRHGVSLVTLRFAWGTDMDFAMLNTRERLDNVREGLPESASRPRILRVDPESEPVMLVSVTGGSDLWATKELAETVFRRRLEQLDGVAEAAVTGGLDREIHIEVDADLLEAYDIELDEVVTALDRANYSAPGGTILRGRYRYPLRTLGEFQTLAEIGDVVVGRQRIEGAEGGPAGSTYRLVRLEDVARVVDGFRERETIARFNGAESVGILVFKESGANTVAVVRDAERVLASLGAEFTEIRTEVAFSQAGFISDSIANVVQALVLGGILAFLVLFLFLRDPRYPVAVALAIPISVVGTFALMDAFHVSLNIMSLGGLALGVGMLVDNSIVVLENVFRHRELDGDAARAAAVGAEEVRGAITASTLTTISVFGPIVYVEGVAGELFEDLSLAVTFSLLVSLLVALTLLPTLAARFGRPRAVDGAASDVPPGGEERPETPTTGAERPHRLRHAGRAVGVALMAPVRWARWFPDLGRQLGAFWMGGLSSAMARLWAPFLSRFDRAYAAFSARYEAVLGWSLDHRRRVLALAGAALAGALALAASLERDLLPPVDQGSFTARLELAEGTGLVATSSSASDLESALLGHPGVAAAFGTVGRDVRGYAEGEETSGLHTAQLQVRLKPGVATSAVLADLRPLADRFPAGALVFETGQATALGQMLGGAGADVAVRVRGDALDAAFDYAALVRDRLARIEELTNVRVGSGRGQPEVQVRIRRDVAARHQIDPALVAETLQQAMQGLAATEFVDFDRKIDIVVRLPDERRHAIETLSTLRIRGVPLRELVDVTEATGPAEIRREDQGRVVVVYADVARGGLDGAIASIESAMQELPPPDRSVRVEVGGENEEMRRSFRNLGFAFGLALILVYMILAAQFESFVHPLTILLAVPLALVGAVLALALAGEGLNTMSLIGIVILVGVVVNDAIIKVDFIHRARRAGRDLRDAILEAGRVRLRPILMTTVTTVLGLAPMALGVGRGADLRAPLAIAVIGGLVVATLLTLVVVPVVYASLEILRGAALGPSDARTGPDTEASVGRSFGAATATTGRGGGA